MFVNKLYRIFAIIIVALFVNSCDDDKEDKTAQVNEQLERVNRESQEYKEATSSRSSTSNSSNSNSSSVNTSSNGVNLSGFLWKPISEGDGKLVILLPRSLRGEVSGVTLSGSFGNVQGRFAGDDKNGLRPHYRFPRRGSEYGNNITVTARTALGNFTWFIPNGALRVSR